MGTFGGFWPAANEHSDLRTILSWRNILDSAWAVVPYRLRQRRHAVCGFRPLKQVSRGRRAHISAAGSHPGHGGRIRNSSPLGHVPEVLGVDDRRHRLAGQEVHHLLGRPHRERGEAGP